VDMNGQMQMLGGRNDSGGTSYDGSQASAPDDFNQAPAKQQPAAAPASSPAPAPAGGAAFDNFDDDIPF